MVNQLFEDFGAATIDADALARRAVEPDKPAYTKVLEVFGKEVRRKNGSLDRRKLRRIIFNDPEKRGQLNAIVHPEVLRETDYLLKRYSRQGVKLVIFEAALLVETGLWQNFDGLIVVVASDELQIERLMKRDRVDMEEAKKSLASQASTYERMQVADYVIDNNSSMENTARQVKNVFSKIISGEG